MAETARDRLIRAKSALENWGRHHDWCATRYTVPGACSCGLAEAIRDATPTSFMSKDWCIAAAEREGTQDVSVGAPSRSGRPAEEVRISRQRLAHLERTEALALALLREPAFQAFARLVDAVANQTRPQQEHAR